MNGQYNKKPFHETEVEKKFYNQTNPYYKGALHTLESTSNKPYNNYPKQNKVKTIRLFLPIIQFQGIKNMNHKIN